MRIGVLELVDEEAPIAALEVARARPGRAAKIASAHEQIDEIELAALLLGRLVPLQARLQFLLQARRQVALEGGHRLLQQLP